MHTYLVRAACFQFALNDGYIAQAFQHFVMRSSIFTIFAIGVGVEDFAKTLVPSNVRPDGSGIFSYIAPNQGYV
jgi:hypothetical protein